MREIDIPRLSVCILVCSECFAEYAESIIIIIWLCYGVPILVVAFAKAGRGVPVVGEAEKKIHTCVSASGSMISLER
jgi:hypothetical protein